MCLHCPLINKPLSDNLFAKLSKASSNLVELKKYSLHFQASVLVGIKIARAHDASGLITYRSIIGQTIPEAGTVKGLLEEGDADYPFKHSVVIYCNRLLLRVCKLILMAKYCKCSSIGFRGVHPPKANYAFKPPLIQIFT